MADCYGENTSVEKVDTILRYPVYFGEVRGEEV